ncbi:hypothetical protein OUZ56_008960 [Daphnia magna]|uniref:Uncharacterized protein n=1 Tax=Daphnia magna TaxID=35525 RepID=A0ABR0AEJ8_9CRUS|nr:hypothetical protein OUZ56_008960 [Daphnia magna]
MADVCGVTGLSFNIPSVIYQISVYVCQEQDVGCAVATKCQATHIRKLNVKLSSLFMLQQLQHFWIILFRDCNV